MTARPPELARAWSKALITTRSAPVIRVSRALFGGESVDIEAPV